MTNAISGPIDHRRSLKSGVEQTNPFTPGFVLEALRRWWKVTIPMGLFLASAVGATLYFTFVPKYQAKALLWIDDQEPVLVSKVKPQGNYVVNQLGLLRSSPVLTPVLSRPEITALPELAEKEVPLTVLQRGIRVRRAFGTEHYYVSFVSPNPENAAKILNAVLESYFAYSGSEESRRTQGLISLLTQEYDVAAREVNLLRENVRVLYMEGLGRDPFSVIPEKEDSPTLGHANLENMIAAEAVERVVLDYKIKAAKQTLQEVSDRLDPEKNPVEFTPEELKAMVEQHSTVVKVKEAIEKGKQNIAALEEELIRIEGLTPDPESAKQLTRYKGHQAQIKLNEQALEALHNELEDLRVKLLEYVERDKRAALAEYRRDILGQHETKIRELENKLRELQIRDMALHEQYEASLEKFKDLKGKTFELQSKRAELNRANEAAQKIANRAFWLRIEQRAPSRIALVEKADVPVKPVTKVPWKKIGVFGSATMFLPFALALLWELRIGRVSDPTQIEKEQLPILAEIVSYPTRTPRTLSRRTKRQLHLFEESVHSLRTALVLSYPIDQVQVLAVTSSVSGEGKTTIAAQLAISIARSSGETTLLIDGDMRAPDIHEVFEIDNDLGFAELLDHQAEIGEMIQHWDEHCHILPAGQLRTSPHRLLGNGSLANILSEVRAKYRHIVIDTPPVLAASEALVLSRAADATILCARRDVSRRDQIEKTCNRLGAAGANLIGCVFSDVPANRYGYRYGYYDYYSSPS